MQISIAAKLVAAAIVALLIVAFGWHEYKAGETAGMAAVQQKWDRQTAAVSQATTAAVTAAASDALANYRAAGASVQQAEQHASESAVVHQDFTKRIQAYANQSGSVGTAGGSAGAGGRVGDCSIDADGLRIWNAANDRANGGGNVSASDSAPSVAQ
jgi:hypothetical protein